MESPGSAKLDPEMKQSLPGSEKVFVQGNREDIKVPMHKISQERQIDDPKKAREEGMQEKSGEFMAKGGEI